VTPVSKEKIAALAGRTNKTVGSEKPNAADTNKADLIESFMRSPSRLNQVASSGISVPAPAERTESARHKAMMTRRNRSP
jgi:hypothetical protein